MRCILGVCVLFEVFFWIIFGFSRCAQTLVLYSSYLALVRSNFEHCSTVWRPVNVVDTCKFESLQKQAIKWIHGEENRSYSDELYALRCKQIDILPLQQHFDINDLLFFHKIVYNIIPVSLPNYISPYDGVSVTWAICHLL